MVNVDRVAFSRRSVLGAGAGAALLGIAGCGGEDTAGSSKGTTRRVPGALGTAEVPVPAKRVVSVGQYRDTDAAVAVGVVPLLSPDLSAFVPGGVAPWVTERLGDRKLEILDFTKLPYEKIAALRPDVILATDRLSLKDEYARLSEIAPTVSWANGYNKDDWRTTTTRVGAALGRSAQARRQIELTDKAIAKAKADNPDLRGLTFTLGPVTGDGTVNTINSTADASVRFLAQLGMKLSPKVTGLPGSAIPGRAKVSPERLDVLDADVVMLTYNTPQARKKLEADDLFRKIPAVRRGAYIGLDLPPALAIGFPSALSIRYGLEQIVPKIRAAIG